MTGRGRRCFNFNQTPRHRDYFKAIKSDDAADEDMNEAIKVMSLLNKGASEAMVEAGIKAATDITGFGPPRPSIRYVKGKRCWRKAQGIFYPNH